MKNKNFKKAVPQLDFILGKVPIGYKLETFTYGMIVPSGAIHIGAWKTNDNHPIGERFLVPQYKNLVEDKKTTYVNAEELAKFLRSTVDCLPEFKGSTTPMMYDGMYLENKVSFAIMDRNEKGEFKKFQITITDNTKVK